MSDGTQRPWPALALAALLVAMTAAAYIPALEAGFIWDDDHYVTENPVLRDLAGLRQIWFEPRSVAQYYPLTFTTLWVEYQLWELEPFGYHLVNVLLHALNAILFWRILRVLGLPGAWLAGAIFAVHPITVESVAWITERKNVLSGACYLGAALAYLRFAPPGDEARQSWSWYALAIALFVAALMSKTVTATLPAGLILVLWWKRGRFPTGDAIALLPFFVLGIAAGLGTAWLERVHVGAMGDEWDHSFVERCLIAGRVFWFYPWTLVWPDNLAFFYPRWQIDAAAWWQYLFPTAALIALGGLFLLRHRLGSGPLVAVLLYAGTLAPALGFLNVYPMRYSFVADHFAYLAILGLIALAAAAAARLASRWGLAQTNAQALVAGLLILLSVLTWQRSLVFDNPETLWRDVIAKNPDGWAGRVNLGGVLADSGEIDEAIAQMEAALDLSPTSPEVHNALGAMWDQQGDLARAETHFREALRITPQYYAAYTNLGIVLNSTGRSEEAVKVLTLAVRLKPRYADAYYHLGEALMARGYPGEAARSFATVLLLAPAHAQAHNALCALQLAEGRTRDAMRHCQEALRLHPSYVEAHENVARALEQVRRTEEARQQSETAQRLRREAAEGHRHTGKVLAEQGRPRAATAQLREALRLMPDDEETRALLGRVLAEEPLPSSD